MSVRIADKIKTREEIAAIRKALADAGKRVAFTSGVFDLMHPGHTDYLEKARALADVLIVGLNSDASVRQNKGELRPICPEMQRAEVLGALASVDFIFVFDEKNNNRNIEILRPDLYVKAGDYDKSKLSSAALVEGYGGRVEIVPARGGFSTTSIIDRIATRYSAAVPSYEALSAPAPAPAIFVDRDGTIIEHVEYLHEPEKLKLLPGALEALKRLREAGFRIVVVTNQPGIGLGYFTMEQFFKVNARLLRESSKVGLAFDRVYFCPHTPADGCSCRKPDPGMLTRGIRELNIQVEGSYMIGDSGLDVRAGRSAGCRTVLVRTGLGTTAAVEGGTADLICEDLEDAARAILKEYKGLGKVE
jgi:rfaE bifunctional protein nucleotidyltransferase chain/domain